MHPNDDVFPIRIWKSGMTLNLVSNKYNVGGVFFCRREGKSRKADNQYYWVSGDIIWDFLPAYALFFKTNEKAQKYIMR